MHNLHSNFGLSTKIEFAITSGLKILTFIVNQVLLNLPDQHKNCYSLITISVV